jgi:rubrerythrin
MREGDIIQRLDRPEVVSHDYYRIRCRVWICSTCQFAVTSPEPISVPPQCGRCGSSAFETVRAEPP